ncbi:MAG: PadR family transcriptional regulator [Candidatus Omnitrophota bacterium]|nr:MAG: PadR family transcriptional regulator [Candidatus Omnitrophota bacterium]
MVQKLIILGFLKRRASSGYDIKKFIEKELGVFSALQTQSIYYHLKKMEKEGSIKRRERKGKKHLKKYLYSITPQGEREFKNLCNQALLSKERPFIGIDIPLYFLPYLAKREAIARLRVRRRFLAKAKEWLETKLVQADNFLPHQRLLLKHHFNLLNAEETFVEEIVEVIKEY